MILRQFDWRANVSRRLRTTLSTTALEGVILNVQSHYGRFLPPPLCLPTNRVYLRSLPSSLSYTFSSFNVIQSSLSRQESRSRAGPLESIPCAMNYLKGLFNQYRDDQVPCAVQGFLTHLPTYKNLGRERTEDLRRRLEPADSLLLITSSSHTYPEHIA